MRKRPSDALAGGRRTIRTAWPCSPAPTPSHGNKDESRRLLGELEQLAQRRYVSPFDMGTVSLALGDEDRALSLLQEAFRQRSSGFIFLRDASFSRMQRAPEFHSLVEKMHFTG